MDWHRKKILTIQGLSLIIAFTVWGVWIAMNGYPGSQDGSLLQVVLANPQPLLTWVLPVLIFLAITPLTLWVIASGWNSRSKSNEQIDEDVNDLLENCEDLPDRQEREQILKNLTRGMRLGKDIDLNLMARTTTGFGRHHLNQLCQAASRNAQHDERLTVNMHDFEQALDQHLVHSVRSPLLDDNLRQLTAYHKAGHTLAAWLIPQAEVIQNASLLSETQPCQDLCHTALEAGCVLSREQLMACLAVLLAGRAAEELLLGDVTNYAADDLYQATRISRWMVARWGMGQMGPVVLDGWQEDNAVPLSELSRARIDRNVQRLLEERYAYAKKLMTTERAHLERLASILMEEETLKREQIAQVLGDRIFTSEVLKMPPGEQTPG